ncbi:hypothetical protein EJ04DRAFT_507147 [Polyplosphaeria fusca]|uniref:Uncharacterized protein n=1 Tax=Polyplosphaeria fusca TaxID=682080 RepID=A0A9P4RDD3_9PLEO|nr:hypothetical protein EJ04DRAFT_507147 [Polyplosphaeria fusca]
MFNFVVMERKLRGYQRNAMTELYVCEVLPQACTLALLEGLEKVYLVPGRQQLTGFPRSGW